MPCRRGSTRPISSRLLGDGFIDLDNWHRRDWRSALEAAGLDPELTPYAMHHTCASFALDAGVTLFELARLMGTSSR
jgi:integrase